ncbi:hypothetical protein ACVILI_005611 [Mesorhizobium sp. USDA 4775]
MSTKQRRISESPKTSFIDSAIYRRVLNPRRAPRCPPARTPVKDSSRLVPQITTCSFAAHFAKGQFRRQGDVAAHFETSATVAGLLGSASISIRLSMAGPRKRSTPVEARPMARKSGVPSASRGHPRPQDDRLWPSVARCSVGRHRAGAEVGQGRHGDRRCGPSNCTTVPFAGTRRRFLAATNWQAPYLTIGPNAAGPLTAPTPPNRNVPQVGHSQDDLPNPEPDIVIWASED